MEMNEVGGACSAYGGEERRNEVLVGKPERNKQMGRPRYGWKDNIKMDLHEME
jgi:hypothetical protein